LKIFGNTEVFEDCATVKAKQNIVDKVCLGIRDTVGESIYIDSILIQLKSLGGANFGQLFLTTISIVFEATFLRTSLI
jgi:hypothetical protein